MRVRLLDLITPVAKIVPEPPHPHERKRGWLRNDRSGEPLFSYYIAKR